MIIRLVFNYLIYYYIIFELFLTQKINEKYSRRLILNFIVEIIKIF